MIFSVDSYDVLGNLIICFKCNSFQRALYRFRKLRASVKSAQVVLKRGSDIIAQYRLRLTK